MAEKVGRNDPCPCGSGKKFKNCCMSKTGGAPKRKFTAKLISGRTAETQTQQQHTGVNLMDRAFGEAVAAAARDQKPPLPKVTQGAVHPHKKHEDKT